MLIRLYQSNYLSPPPRYLPCPKISIIIPLYNAEEYIGECLDSIFNQTFQSFEVILVDDCSTDSSLAIVESYTDKFNGRLRITKTKTNSGGGGYIPRNIGLGLASGEYVWFVDADDFILLSALETLYNAAKESDADVVYTGSHYQLRKRDLVRVLRDGKGKQLQEDNIEDTPTLIVNEFDRNLHALIFEKGFTTPWTHFVRKDLLLKNNITFPAIPKAGDYIWAINVYCYAEKFLRFTTPLYFYRIYNANSVSQRKANVNELFDWVSAFATFAKSMMSLSERIEILRKNPSYCYEASRRYFNWCLNRTNDARKKLSNQEMYEILHREFSNRNDSSNFTIPFLFSTIEENSRDIKDNVKIIDRLQKELDQFNKSSARPLISVIIPLYNSEKYIAECLDSILNQTFQNFELILVDDCSTDSSCEIVESYISKFDGRLKLCHMDENTGSGALPRNKGLALSIGKYVFNMDNDDMLTKTALEELYTLAEEYDADIVYCEKFYEVNPDGSNIKEKTLQKGGLVNKPTLESEDLNERVQAILNDRYYVVPWTKLIRRNLLIENEIIFPGLKISDDNIWHQGSVFCAKKFLRVPNIVYIYRLTETSILRREKTPQCNINFWLDPVMRGLKTLDKLMGRQEFFKANPSCRYALLKKFVDTRFIWTLKDARELSEEEIYSTIKDEFGEKFGDSDVLIPVLCTALYNEKKSAQIIDKFSRYFTARIDLQLTPKTNEDALQILSVSDNKTKVSKPDWFQKNGIGYVVTSYSGQLEIIAKAVTEGKLKLELKGIDMRRSEDRSKHVPYWIDYTALSVNGEKIFDTLTPAWHNKPYRYFMDVKADEEITIQVEWLPHRSDT